MNRSMMKSIFATLLLLAATFESLSAQDKAPTPPAAIAKNASAANAKKEFETGKAKLLFTLQLQKVNASLLTSELYSILQASSLREQIVHRAFGKGFLLDATGDQIANSKNKIRLILMPGACEVAKNEMIFAVDVDVTTPLGVKLTGDLPGAVSSALSERFCDPKKRDALARWNSIGRKFNGVSNELQEKQQSYQALKEKSGMFPQQIAVAQMGLEKLAAQEIALQIEQVDINSRIDSLNKQLKAIDKEAVRYETISKELSERKKKLNKILYAKQSDTRGNPKSIANTKLEEQMADIGSLMADLQAESEQLQPAAEKSQRLLGELAVLQTNSAALEAKLKFINAECKAYKCVLQAGQSSAALDQLRREIEIGEKRYRQWSEKALAAEMERSEWELLPQAITYIELDATGILATKK